MYVSRFCLVALTVGLAAWFAAISPTKADEVQGVVKSVDLKNRSLVLTEDGTHREITVRANVNTAIKARTGKKSGLGALKSGAHVVITDTLIAAKIDVNEPATAASPAAPKSVLQEFWYNFRHNLFKPLLLFFYLGFLVPILRVKFEFPYVMYQGLTIYLLVAIGWHGGEELSRLDPRIFGPVFGFMAVGFATNFVVGIIAYLALRSVTRLRKIDCATVAGFYGSDSAGTFVTCLGVLGTINIAFDAYMPVMLAVMEIPGCLVALYLVARLRHQGMDPLGNMPSEAGYDPNARPLLLPLDGHGHGDQHVQEAIEDEKKLSLEEMEHEEDGNNEIAARSRSVFSPKLLHEVFLNPGLFLLFGGIVIGFIRAVCKGRRSLVPMTTSSSPCSRECSASSSSRWG